MTDAGALSGLGAAVGDPTRARMLCALFDGRPMSAGALADRAGVTPQTASGHLARLLAAGLISVEQHGRRRHHRLASAEVARLIETMMLLGQGRDDLEGAKPAARSVDPAMRTARTCYDHLAGRLGVALADALGDRGLVRASPGQATVTDDGLAFLRGFGIDVDAAPKSKRMFCGACLDWTERRPHLSGAVGARLLDRSLEQGWVRRLDGTRALRVTPAGGLGFRRTFGVSLLD